MTDEKAAAINKVRYSMLHFAWDNPNDLLAFEKLKEYKDVWKGSTRNRTVYILTNFNSSPEEDLSRVYAVRDIGYDPYIMIFDKPNAPKETRYLISGMQKYRGLKC